MNAPYPFDGRLLLIGFGCIGRGVLPLLLRHIDLQPEQLLIITPDDADRAIAEQHGVPLKAVRLTEDNYRAELEPLLGPGDFLLNLSVEVESAALIALCQERSALYLDTCTEPWAGAYTDTQQSASERSNYALRERLLARRRGEESPGSTALITHGANPGLVSHLVKQALLNLAEDCGQAQAAPQDRLGWATMAQRLGVRCIHIAERDTQYAAQHKADDEFVNTWSVDGFISEACQPAELGWGSHEKTLPVDGRRHAFGCQAAIYLQRPGAATRVRTWTPSGPTQGFLVTHSEAISIADYLTVGRGEHPEYRPTVHYAYQPCDDALLSLHELAARNWQPQTRQRLLDEEIVAGRDELGVLLLGHARTAYWFGSRLSIEEARALCPHNSATSLQVTATVMAGVIWAMANPDRGILEPDQLPHEEILALCRPYLGELVGLYSDWTPLQGRERLFDEALDRDDPWQFINFRAD